MALSASFMLRGLVPNACRNESHATRLIRRLRLQRDHPCPQMNRTARLEAARRSEKNNSGENRDYGLDDRWQLGTRVSAAQALLRLGVFAGEARDELGYRLHGFDRANALAAAPDVPPRLGFLSFRRASGSEVHRLGLALRQAFRVEPGPDDRGPQVVAE